jgi:hypothetical protein
MSESVQCDDQWSSLPDMVHFRYDDQHPSLPAEGLILLIIISTIVRIYNLVGWMDAP